MITSINKNRSFPPRQTMVNNWADDNPEKHKAFLYSIAKKLGLGEQESHRVVEQTLRTIKSIDGHYNDFTFRVRLSKAVVHNCIFKISSDLFSRKKAGTDLSIIFRIPISFSIVYILFNLESFSEKEIAYILNITPFQVRERLTRAVMLLHQSAA